MLLGYIHKLGRHGRTSRGLHTMRNALRIAAFCGVVSVQFLFSGSAFACSVAAWGANTGGTAGSPLAIPRYSELCAFEVTGQHHVQSNFASDTRYRVRFYVLDGLTGSGSVDIFEAYGNEAPSGPLFKVSFDGSQFTFNATAAGGTSTTVAGKNGWNVVELDWTSGGQMRFWLNADATPDINPTGTVNAGTGTVEAIRLGAPNGLGTQTGKLVFDAFESHRTTPIGLLLVGDANGNSSVNIFDMIGIQNEILNPATSLAVGQPDCNENGSVNVFDMICVQNIILGGN